MARDKVAIVKNLDDEEKNSYLCTENLKPGDKVVVQNDAGVFLGQVTEVLHKKCDEKSRTVLRLATQEDVKKNQQNQKMAKEALKKAKELAREQVLDMKITSAKYSLDGSKLIFSFVSENRVDFRDFVKDLAAKFKTRIELKQIGSRDEVKLCGGIGVCGKVCCCNEFLPEFAKVSIKMAKNQNLSLTPQKINGLCGRLMCCLSYENENYANIMSKMPKQGSEVMLKDGRVGTAVYNDILKERVTVKITDKDGNFELDEFDVADLKVKTYALKQ